MKKITYAGVEPKIIPNSIDPERVLKIIESQLAILLKLSEIKLLVRDGTKLYEDNPGEK